MADEVVTPAMLLPKYCHGCENPELPHHGFCITNLVTPEGRIAFCAHLCRCHASFDLFTAQWKAKILGFTDAEFAAGRAMYRAEEEEYRRWCGTYGSPPWGGWITDKRDGRRKPHQVVPKEFRQ